MLNRVVVSLLLLQIYRTHSLLMLATAAAYFSQLKLEYTPSRRVKRHEMEVSVSHLRVKAM